MESVSKRDVNVHLFVNRGRMTASCRLFRRHGCLSWLPSWEPWLLAFLYLHTQRRLLSFCEAILWCVLPRKAEVTNVFVPYLWLFVDEQLEHLCALHLHRFIPDEPLHRLEHHAKTFDLPHAQNNSRRATG